MGKARNKFGHWLRLSKAGRLPDLGDRELAVLEIMWAHGEQSAQSVQHHMHADPISLSTIQSTLERLFRKELLTRSKTGRAYVYRTCVSRSQLIGGLIRDLAQDLAGGELAPMVSGFLEYVATENPELGPRISQALADEVAPDDPPVTGKRDV